MYVKQLLTLKLTDELFLGQFLRTLAASASGCADIGECFVTAARTADGDFEAWCRAWNAMARRVREAAEESLRQGHAVSARDGFLRANEYFRQSVWFLRDNLDDPRLLQAADDQRACFRAAMDLSAFRAEAVEIPYEGTTLGGYLFRADASGAPRPTLILPGGYDGIVEESYQSGAKAAVERGYNCLAFDGPGQGHVLLRQRQRMRPDFEAVIRPVIDWLVAQPGVMADQLVLMGRSFGGYLAPRGACGETRLAALVCDPGQISLAAAVKERMPPEIMRMLQAGDRKGVDDFFAAAFAGNPMMRFFFASRMPVHGTDTVYDFLTEVLKYDFTDKVGTITCPTLVCDNPTDVVSTRGRTLYDALRCEKTLVTFTAEDGAGAHCEAGASRLFERRVFDWIDTIVSRPR